MWDSSTYSYVSTPKPFGRALLASELPLGLARFFYPSPALSPPSSAELSGAVPPSALPPTLPTDLLLPVLRTLRRRLDSLIEVVQTLEIRMRGGSLLIVVEGDAAALEASLLRAQAAQTAASKSSKEEEEDDAASEASTTDGEGTAAPHTLIPFEMRLIDFAHTRAADPSKGESGPDEGVLLGLRTIRELLVDLIEKVTLIDEVEE